jgi:hypothetical protein
MVLACTSFFPGFHMLMKFGNPDLEAATRNAPVTVMADPAQCTFQFDLFGTAKYTSPCDLARNIITGVNVPYTNTSAPGAAAATIKVGNAAITVPSGAAMDGKTLKAFKAKTTADIKAALVKAGYPAKADPKKAQLWPMFGILVIFAIACTALYGPMASLLVEMFPTRVRYTAMSLPYNIGTGWFGGIQPALSFAIVAATGNIYAGLWYPVGVGITAIIVALLFLKETKGRDLNAVG